MANQANNNHTPNKYAMEDLGLILGTTAKLVEHCTMCNPLEDHYVIKTEGKPDVYFPTNKDELKHCIIDLRSGLTTFCKLYGHDDGYNLLKKHLDICANSKCGECQSTVVEIENYFTVIASEIKKQITNNNYDAG